jgi:hypothetical protein
VTTAYCNSAGNGNLGAFTLPIRFGALDQQRHAVPGPGHMFDVQPNEFRAAHGTGEAEQEQRAVAGAGEGWSRTHDSVS